MRISDWSSDVCSSDLSTLGAAYMGFLSNLFGGNKEDKALREALAHIHRILDDEKFQLELVHPMMKVMLESARSEEHTSELQSLMRISYAVFCLIQKKIETTIRILYSLTFNAAVTQKRT